MKLKWLVGIVGLTTALPALAYIGPGAGISFIGSLFSTLLVVVLAVGAVLMWPLRYVWRRLRRLTREAKAGSEGHDEAEHCDTDPVHSKMQDEAAPLKN